MGPSDRRSLHGVGADRDEFYVNSGEVRSGDVTLRVVDRGPAGGVPVLMLHGWPDSAWLWRNQVPQLVDAGFRLLIPDQRGFGGSSRPSDVEAYSMSRLIGDAIAVLDWAGVEQAHVVGHDWGAGLAWLLAAYRGDRVASLTAISVGHPAAFFEAGIRQLSRSWYMILFLFEGAAEQFLSDNDWSRFRRFVGGHPDTDSWIADLSRPGALTASLNWYRANAPIETYLRDEVNAPAVNLDVLGIWSAGDFALIEEQMTGSDRYVNGQWRYHRVEDASHWVPLDAPGLLTELLIDWIGSRAG